MVNNGVVKVQRLSVVIKVHRGLADMKLPEKFLSKDSTGVRTGVEFGFMSTTANEDVALQYLGTDTQAPRTVHKRTNC